MPVANGKSEDGTPAIRCLCLSSFSESKRNSGFLSSSPYQPSEFLIFCPQSGMVYSGFLWKGRLGQGNGIIYGFCWWIRYIYTRFYCLYELLRSYGVYSV